MSEPDGSPAVPDDHSLKDQAYQCHTKEQFEALGRFVQAFELMVNALRSGATVFLASSAPRRASIVFHHQALTARPLVDIWRAMAAQICKAQNIGLDKKELAIKTSVEDKVLLQVAKDVTDLVGLRNAIVHGTWFIGWFHPDDTDFSRMAGHKLKIAKDGLQPTALPTTASGMLDLVRRSENVASLIHRVNSTLALDRHIQQNVKHIQGYWWALDDLSQSSAPKP